MALIDWSSNPDCLPNGSGVATIACIEPLLKNVIGSLAYLAGIALFIMLLVGGFSFLFAGGDQKKLEKAKTTLSAAVIGIVIMIVAFLILKTIEIFTGVNVTTVQVKTNF
jgi:hypothetical protein